MKPNYFQTGCIDTEGNYWELFISEPIGDFIARLIYKPTSWVRITEEKYLRMKPVHNPKKGQAPGIALAENDYADYVE